MVAEAVRPSDGSVGKLSMSVVLGVVFAETDEVASLSAGVDILLLVWLVAVVAGTMEAEAVLTFSTSDVGADVDEAMEAMDDEVATLFAGVGVVLLLVVMGLSGVAVLEEFVQVDL